jgi:AmpE protein
MNAVAMLIALLVERFFDCSHLRSWRFYPRYQHVITKRFNHLAPYALLALVVVTPMLLMMLVMWMIRSVFYGFLGFLFSVLVLLYCFGPRNWWADVAACQQALSAGENKKAMEELYAALGMTAPHDMSDWRHQGVEALLLAFHCRLFANLVWFGLFGVAGAVGYRLVALAARQAGTNTQDNAKSPLATAALRVESYLDWFSIRILTLLFAIRKQFQPILACWQGHLADGVEANGTLLQACGTLALNETGKTGAQPEGFLARLIHLLDRSLVCFFVIIAVWILLVSY